MLIGVLLNAILYGVGLIISFLAVNTDTFTRSLLFKYVDIGWLDVPAVKLTLASSVLHLLPDVHEVSCVRFVGYWHMALTSR